MAFGAAPGLASTVTVNSGTLVIQGDPDDDAISISTDGTTLTIVDTGTGGAVDNDADCAQVNPTTVTCAVNPVTPPTVTRYSVSLDNGVDSFTNQNFVTEIGQVAAPGDMGAKTIFAGPGDQILLGGLDSDNLDGGDGDDLLFDGSQFTGTQTTGGNDVLFGGNGDDETEYFRPGTVGLNISVDGVANDGVPGEADNVQVENVTAGNGNDVLVGDNASNMLAGAQGSDQVSGLGGNDELLGDLPEGGGAAARGIPGLGGGDDTLNGGAGRDGLDCGRGFDLALRDPLDEIEPNCERIGAEVVGDSAAVSGKKKNKFKVEIECPESEGATCSGKLKITAADKKIGKGKFSVGAGNSKRSKAKLTKKGVKALKRAGGSLLVTVLAKTTEPGGVSEDSGAILLHR